MIDDEWHDENERVQVLLHFNGQAGGGEQQLAMGHAEEEAGEQEVAPHGHCLADAIHDRVRIEEVRDQHKLRHGGERGCGDEELLRVLGVGGLVGGLATEQHPHHGLGRGVEEAAGEEVHGDEEQGNPSGNVLKEGAGQPQGQGAVVVEVARVRINALGVQKCALFDCRGD